MIKYHYVPSIAEEYNVYMDTSDRNTHSPIDFDLDIFSGDLDLFRWFLLCFLFGKPIRSETAVKTWKLLVEQGMDTPWAINDAHWHELSRILCEGGYRRYDTVTAHGLQKCVLQLLREYDGSLWMMLESSPDKEELSKRLQALHGVGPKVTEIFMSAVQGIFAQKVEYI